MTTAQTREDKLTAIGARWGSGFRNAQPFSAPALEAKGWEVWLRTLFPFAFTESFSDDHRLYWDLRWSVFMRIRDIQNGIPQHIASEELTILYILGRALGKSASIEPSAIMRGALLNGGYSLFVSETDDQAQEHLGNTRILIEHPDSKLLNYYPMMSIAADKSKGLPDIDRRELFIAKNGWIARAKGLKSKMRGLRVGTQRPNQILCDDIDDVNDSAALSEAKLRILTSSILPVQDKFYSTIDFTQNLISENSVINQIYTGRSDAMAERTVIGPTKTFSKFEYDTVTSEDGRLRHVIRENCETSWSGVNVTQAQKFLSDSGLATFMAEYQNDFSQQRAGRVLPNWDDDVHTITWSQFNAFYRTDGIPDRWYKYAFNDWARTKSAYHANVAGFVAVAGQYGPLPGAVFMFNPLSFPEKTEADDVAVRIIKTVAPEVEWDEMLASSLNRAGLERYTTNLSQLMEQRRQVISKVIPPTIAPILRTLNYVKWKGSHEQAQGALRVYQEVYGLPFEPVNPGKDGGLEYINHLMQVDYDQDHPFHEGKPGFTRFFLIVPDHKSGYPTALQPDSLHDEDLARYQFAHWRNVPLKMTELGIVEHGPEKMNDDFGNGLQFLFCDSGVVAAPLDKGEKIEAAMPEELALTPELTAYDRQRIMTSRQFEYQRVEREMSKPRGRNALRLAQWERSGKGR